MKFAHAMGFLSIGLVMLVLPQVAPGLCPRNGFDGTSGRELWLYVMGTLQVALGGGVCVWNIVGVAIALGETLPDAVAGILEHATAESEEEIGARGTARVAPFEFERQAEWAGRDAA